MSSLLQVSFFVICDGKREQEDNYGVEFRCKRWIGVNYDFDRIAAYRDHNNASLNVRASIDSSGLIVELAD